jgi:hypothetical protein
MHNVVIMLTLLLLSHWLMRAQIAEPVRGRIPILVAFLFGSSGMLGASPPPASLSSCVDHPRP